MSEIHDLLEEAKQDARIEQIIKFWRAYGNHIIGAILIALTVTFGWIYWDYRTEQKKIRAANLYDQVITFMDKGENELADQALKDLLKESSNGYGILAQMRLAGEDYQKTHKISDFYEQIINDKKVDEKFRDLAVIVLSLQSIDQDQGKINLEQLRTIAEGKSPFSANAREIIGLVYLKEGDPKAALQIFKDLSQEEGVTEGIRLRARAMLEQFNR